MSPFLSLADVRALLGEDGAALSDDELEKVREQASRHATIICEVLKHRRQSSERGSLEPTARRSKAVAK